jgi:hypothetical protein
VAVLGGGCGSVQSLEVNVAACTGVATLEGGCGSAQGCLKVGVAVCRGVVILAGLRRWH